jgi:hypothetical protein
MFASNILALQAAGCNVITDDLIYPNEPLFSVGRVGQAVEQVFNQGVVYTTSAGNFGNEGFEAPWTPVNATVDTVNGTFQDFGGGSPLQPFTLVPGNSLDVSFFWDAAYLENGSPLPNFQVPNNLTAYVVDTATGKIVGTFNANGMNTDEAFQNLIYTNNTNDSTFAFAFQLSNGPAPQAIGWVQNDNGVNNPLNALGEVGPVSRGHEIDPDTLTMGAVPWFNPGQPENFSAVNGNMPLFSDANGNRFAQPLIVQKPDLVAPDRVHTSFFSDQFLDANGNPTFPGTSAAAPHAAAAAALLMQEAPGVDPFTIDQHLRDTALDLLTPGFDASTGFGLIQLSPLNIPADRFDPNQTSDIAADLGSIGSVPLVENNLTIGNLPNGLPNYDWYKFSAANDGAVTVVMNNARLELHLFALDSNGDLNPISNGSFVSAGTEVYVEVKGAPLGYGPKGEKFTQGFYDLTLSVV